MSTEPSTVGPETPCTVLFVDIVGSTRLYDAHGDREGERIVRAALEALSTSARDSGGAVIKTIGDAVMCTFDDPNQAVRGARKMHLSLDRLAKRPDIPAKLLAKVGLQQGVVVRRDGDVFGDAVNVAARMVEIAHPRQILTTRHTVDLLDEKLADSARFIDQTVVAGKPGEAAIYELVWEQSLVTIVQSGRHLHAALDALLVLRVGDRTWEISLTNPEVTLGRVPENDICVEHHRTSRWHARIQCRRGKFVLTDTSSNGTVLQREGREPVTVRREELELRGRGVLGLGFVASADDPTMVQYDVRSSA